jgi:putative aminopeptidase FrvX
MKELLIGIAERLMRCPAAPYCETQVAREVMRICEENNLRYKFDPFGNLVVRAASRLTSKPIVLAAHMDHPGFVFPKAPRSGALTADFLGGVGDAYFKQGVSLRLWPGNIPATLGKEREKRSFEIETHKTLSSRPEFAVWDLPEFEYSKEIIRGRVCDDLIGVATILSVLIEARSFKAAANLIGVLSRAEEVGFHGALALATSKVLSKDSLVISLETSRELPPVKMGAGVIVRVGDRASIFDSDSTRFLAEVAGDLARKDAAFKFQRALMSGGTCEATAYQEYGYRCAAVCVALGNYHNCGDNDRVEAEFVNAGDAESMGRLLLECAKVWSREHVFSERLPKRLEMLLREARRELKKRPLGIGSDERTKRVKH